jgi:hypothetical protein
MGCGSSVVVPAATRPRALSCEESVDDEYASRAKYKPIVWQAEPPSTNNTEKDNQDPKGNKEKRDNVENTGKDECTANDKLPLLIIEKSSSMHEEVTMNIKKTPQSSLPPIKSAIQKPQKCMFTPSHVTLLRERNYPQSHKFIL